MQKNLLSKVLLVTFLLIILLTISTICWATDEDSKSENIEICLNRKVEFVGKVHRYSTGYKMLFLSSVKKTYSEDKPGCGIIDMILKDQKYGVHILGEGWIAPEQIISSTKYIQITFESGENDKVISTLKVDGEYIDINSNNDGIIKFENGELKAGTNGKTNVKIKTSKGETIDLLAIVDNGEISLNIPEKSLSSDMDVDATAVDIIKVSSDNGNKLYIKDGSLQLNNKNDLDVNINSENVVNVDTSENLEIKKSEKGVDVKAGADQNFSFLTSITAALKEAISSGINNEGIKDPSIDINANVLDNQLVNIQNKTIPVVTTLKTIITKLFSK